jgi:predicted ArsR family transcriptional regulator
MNIETSIPSFNNKNINTLSISERIYNCIKKNNNISRDQIAFELNLPRTTVFDNLVQLLVKGLVEKKSAKINERGRPIVFYTIKKTSEV